MTTTPPSAASPVEPVRIAHLRQAGWTPRVLTRAVAALGALVETTTTELPTDDRRLADELLRWLRAGSSPEAGKDDRGLAGAFRYARCDLPPVPPEYAELATLLDGAEDDRAARLRRLADPTSALVAMVEDVAPRPGDDCSRALPAPHRAAILAIGELATAAGVRALLSWLDELEGDVRAALALAGGALLAPTIELWPTLRTYHRAVLVEAVGKTKARSEELFALLVAWLADPDDRFDAAMAIADYGDPRAVPHLMIALDQALADGDDATVREIDHALRDDFATDPTPAQRERIAALPPRRFAPVIVETVPDAEAEPNAR